MAMTKAERAARRKLLRARKKEAIIKLTGNPTLATLYRDRSAKVIKRDLGINIKQEEITPIRPIPPEQWGEWAKENENLRKNRQTPNAYPQHILRYAVLKNRELSRQMRERNRPAVDEYSKYGFAFAYLRVVEGRSEREIKRLLKWDPNAKLIIYTDVARVA